MISNIVSGSRLADGEESLATAMATNATGAAKAIAPISGATTFITPLCE
ncbi:hypothetical protein [Pseudomonas sp. PDM12]|nr:hypothetical protein [Pseudomonas sp. PDM12]